MGKTDNPDAVLDSQARVYGVSKLRVVDASSLPFLVPGHPMATICESTLFVPSRVTVKRLSS